MVNYMYIVIGVAAVFVQDGTYGISTEAKECDVLTFLQGGNWQGGKSKEEIACLKLRGKPGEPFPQLLDYEDYLNQVCNVTSKALSTSLRLESSTTLSYSAGASCSYHVVADAGKQVLLLVRLFTLENVVSGSCVDYANIHDGADTNAATINASPVCGQSAAANYTSTGNDMTVYFRSDATGSSSGFDLIFVAISTGTCSSSQFSCVNTSICIDSSLTCNTLDECGDNSDEQNCVYWTPTDVDTDSNTGLIAGAIVGGLVFLVVCIVGGYQLWKYIRWRYFKTRPVKAKTIEFEPTTYQTTYPVTRLYYKERIQDMYEDPVKAARSGHIVANTSTSGDMTSFTDHVTSSSSSSSNRMTGIRNDGYDASTE